MRIILFMIFAIVSSMSYSQLASYNDLGILFSKENNRGTARFNAMSGAFGALGGDISSTDINPAGGAVARKSSLSITIGNTSNNITSNYYGNSFDKRDSKNNISQVGGLLAFDSAYNSKWNHFSLFFNYNIKNNYSRSYTAEGFSFPLFDEHFSDSSTAGQFDRNLYQYISNETKIKASSLNIGFSSAYENKLFLGASFKIHNLEFSETAVYNEENDDIDGNILNIEDYNETYIQSTGVSLNLGFIYKLNKNIRFGLAYETPTWYQEVIEDYYNELYMSGIEDLEIDSYLAEDQNSYIFSYKSVSKITASSAYIFGKLGLISIDYTYRDYKNIRFDNSDFSIENENFNTDYRNTYSLKVGTEWRFNKLSFRGGVSYEKDPNLTIGDNTSEDNIKSFSLGLGYNFGNSQFDISYTNTQNTDFKSIYDTGDLTINNNISQVSGTLTINL